MKRIITCVFTLSFALSLYNVSAFAQGRDVKPPTTDRPAHRHETDQARDRAPVQTDRQADRPAQRHETDLARDRAKQVETDRHAQRHATDLARDRARDLEFIDRNPQVHHRLKAMLPADMDIANARTGFKNRGEFVAAMHVSHNLSIPFAALKQQMTGDSGKSLGQAIHELRPDVDAKEAVKKAEKQAKTTLKTDSAS